MNKLLMLGCLLLLLSAGQAATDPPAEIREDTASYRLEEPGLQAGGAALGAPLTTEDRIPELPVPLAELRTRQQAAREVLVDALRGARDKVERDDLERRAADLKTTQEREELEWLRADALRRGDSAYAGRLAEALRDLEPTTAAAPAPRVGADSNSEGEDK